MDQICKFVCMFGTLELMEEIDFTIFGQRPKPSVSVMGHINTISISRQYVRSNLTLGGWFTKIFGAR